MIIIVTGFHRYRQNNRLPEAVKAVGNQGYKCGGILTYKDATSRIIIEDIQSGEKEILAGSSSECAGTCNPRSSFNPKLDMVRSRY